MSGGRTTRRHGRPAERGQVLVLFVLISVTIFLICVFASAAGQALVRRHQAQLVADAAAWAGASKQAEGMNVIARYNEKSFNLLTGIQVSMQVPYMDNSDTTWARIFLLVGAPFYNDWAGDAVKDYKKIFDGIDNYIQAVNLAYASPPYPAPAITQTTRAAKRVVDANFAGGDSTFKPEDLRAHGCVLDPGKSPLELVKLTSTKEVKLDIPFVHGLLYVPYVGHYAVTCVPGPYCVNVPCCLAKAALATAYGAMFTYHKIIRPPADPFKYKFGRYYDQPSGQDVRFTYFVEVDSSPVIFGRNFFSDIPPILAVATGKPYGGYLGTYLDGPLTGQENGKEVSYTYEAKLVPVRQATVAALAAQRGFDGGAQRYLSVTH